MPFSVDCIFATEEYSDFYYGTLFNHQFTFYFDNIRAGRKCEEERNYLLRRAEPEADGLLRKFLVQEGFKPLNFNFLLTEAEYNYLLSLVREKKEENIKLLNKEILPEKYRIFADLEQRIMSRSNASTNN